MFRDIGWIARCILIRLKNEEMIAQVLIFYPIEYSEREWCLEHLHVYCFQISEYGFLIYVSVIYIFVVETHYPMTMNLNHF